MLGIEAILKELGADNGLANYDRTNDLETLLKNIVNVNKDTLQLHPTTISYNLPIVGPTLGPSECNIFLCCKSFEHLFCSCLRDQMYNRRYPRRLRKLDRCNP